MKKAKNENKNNKEVDRPIMLGDSVTLIIEKEDGQKIEINGRISDIKKGE